MRTARAFTQLKIWTRSLALSSLSLEVWISAHSIPTSLCVLRSSSLVHPCYIPVPQPQEHKAFQVLCHKVILKMWFV